MPRSSRNRLQGYSRSRAPLAVNLGIDFGTRFTKVCFRDVATEESKVVTFGENTTEEAMIPSVVAIGSDGTLSLSSDTSQGTATRVQYLKMSLAGEPIPAGPSFWRGMVLDDQRAVQALSSWFLAKIIALCRQWIRENQRDRFAGRKVDWSANVGVPVEYCDSPAINTFREAFAVGWQWAKAGGLPLRFEDALKRYEEDAGTIDQERNDCHAVPEIAAAVQSFIISRQARPGIYIYFDIGAGTMDGVAFDYSITAGRRRVDFLSGKVQQLGVTAIARGVGNDNSDAIEAVEAGIVRDVQDRMTLGLGRKLLAYRKKVRQLVAWVIMTAKKKDGRDWQRQIFPGRALKGGILSLIDPRDMRPLPVFLGGGGAASKCYQRSVLSTYRKHGHRSAGVPPYRLQDAPKPADLDMNGLPEDGFRRFAVAYGLSVPYGEGPEIGLPSANQPPPPLPPKPPPMDIVPYPDTKDVNC